MNRVILSFLLAISAFTGVWAQGEVWVTGHVFGEDTTIGVPDIHIYNRRTFKGDISNYFGFFRVKMRPGDTIVFTSVQYLDEFFVLPDGLKGEVFNLKAFLRPQRYFLEEVEIYEKMTFQDFKVKFFQNRTYSENLALKYARDLPKAPPIRPEGGVGIVIDGPLTALYDAFSKKGKEKRRFAEQMSYYNALDIQLYTYRREVVRRVTKIEDRDELYEFIEFCDLPISFIRTASDWELLERIDKCRMLFQAQRNNRK